jgi:hypothetical protein
MLKPGQSIGYGLSLDEVLSLPYSIAIRMIEFLEEMWDKERTEIQRAKSRR